MTTAHRPTFDPAKGDAAQAPTRLYSSQSLPAHRVLKYRQAGQGTEAEAHAAQEQMRNELLAKEAEHYDKTRPVKKRPVEENLAVEAPPKLIGMGSAVEEETQEEKRRRIWEETKDMDADDSDAADEAGQGSESEEESDDEDETAELMRELAKIKAERAAEQARKAQEAEADDQAQREEAIAFGNPLLNPEAGDAFAVKRRWDEDVVFRVKEKDESGKKDFVNDMLRSDFHRSFMKKYVR
ncbi:Pre-mRNA-splicing factor Cwf15/Cwc15 [Protomyces lactucae-debilis]|uniref:Pre-mRNA-splicing factor Cwf15/Cwc15 n=1 Tax=Protomyces lactucae-debilis TaxID=2754530 RepID=A0A1Y2FP36_PROLT|nr:Pre-mRNA-splicing factor Cwf15/Cwc15 [Protomyces lactucae-debilis]ORY84966.1 Pre-mRNA-splicing factor Cwf15/Cwc15 [Protomyces lactucae-debilis]